MGFPGGRVVKNLPAKAGDVSLILEKCQFSFQLKGMVMSKNVQTTI